MILVDANLLLYAEDSSCPRHQQARAWFDALISGGERVCLCWPVINAFIRIGTNPRVYEVPFSMEEAIGKVEGWFEQPTVRIVSPTDDHWKIFKRLLDEGQAVANLVSDAHLAALAIEHGCVLCSTDADFSRFPRLKWVNPLKGNKSRPAKSF